MSNDIIWIERGDHLDSPELVYKSKACRRYQFVQPFDGLFGYSVWVNLPMQADSTCICVMIDEQKMVSSEKVTLPGRDGYFAWTRVGVVELTKGMHQLLVENLGDMEVYLPRIVLVQNDEDMTPNGPKDRDSIKNQGELDSKQILKRLHRMGFVEDPLNRKLASDAKCRNGVPMGGIGAGKIEIDKDGIFTGITINNNQDVPIYRSPGSFFAVRVEEKGSISKSCKVLQTTSLKYDFSCVDKIDFTGCFPKACLGYSDSDLVIDLSLQAFSSLVPYDVKNSSIPGVVFSFKVSNPTQAVVKVSLLFSWENMVGTGGSMKVKSDQSLEVYNTWNPGYVWSNRTGTHQSIVDGSQYKGLFYTAHSDNGNPMSFGNYSVICEKKRGQQVSVLKSWNIDGDGSDLWEVFDNDPESMESTNTLMGVEETCYVGGAVCTTLQLDPGKSDEVVFVLSWNMPTFIGADKYDYGVYYTRYFNDSLESAMYLLENRVDLLEQTSELHVLMRNSSLPWWLQDKLINDMFTIYTCTWFTRDGRFAVNEAPSGMMGCLGTIDQRLSSHSIYSLFWPELDETELDLFRMCQGVDGSISHDLGFGEFVIDKRGGTWTDLASSFILQVYKYHIYTADYKFFNKFYPHCRSALLWEKSVDMNGDGIPDVGPGHGTTYDTYHWFGSSPFVAILWLCALRAMKEMARVAEDHDLICKCDDWYEEALETLFAQLWVDTYPVGGYFRSYFDRETGKMSDNCFIAQMAGQWFAELVHLGNLIPQEKVREALRTITKLNVLIAGVRGMNDETRPDGTFDWYHYTFVQYDETYYGCLAIYNDMVEEGLQCFKKVYEMSVNSPWNVCLTYKVDGTPAGLPYYMTNSASWFVLNALAGYVPDIAHKTLVINPHLRKGEKGLSIPLFSPALWMNLDYEILGDGGERFSITPIKQLKKRVCFDRFVTYVERSAKHVEVSLNHMKADSVRYCPDSGKLTIESNFDMSQPLVIAIDVCVSSRDPIQG